MLVAQISDLHIRPRGAIAYGVSETDLFAEHAVHALLRLDPRPDCVIVTGDLTDCGLDEEYAILRELFSRLPMPVYAIPGNHDRREPFRQAPGARCGDDRAEIGILACPLQGATPARIAGDVDHRRKGPVDAGSRSLPPTPIGGLLDQLGIPARGLAERKRKIGREAMDRVEPDDQWDLQPTLASRLLHRENLRRHNEVHHRAHLAAADLIDVEAFAAPREVQLANLLLERHLPEQRVDTPLDRLRLPPRLPGDGLLRRRGGSQAEQKDGNDQPQSHARRSPCRHAGCAQPNRNA